MKCRNCKKNVTNKWIDLGHSPPSNNYLSKKDLNKKETYLPLKVYVCKNCWLSQTKDYTNSKKLFRSDYAYFSSTSKSFLIHAKKYSNKMIKKLNLNSRSHVIEIASNDGYLLKNFFKKKIPCMGIEPTINTAREAEKIEAKELFRKDTASGDVSVFEGRKSSIFVQFIAVPSIDSRRFLASSIEYTGNLFGFQSLSKLLFRIPEYADIKSKRLSR